MLSEKKTDRMLEITPWWTSIPSRRSKITPISFTVSTAVNWLDLKGPRQLKGLKYEIADGLINGLWWYLKWTLTIYICNKKLYYMDISSTWFRTMDSIFKITCVSIDVNYNFLKDLRGITTKNWILEMIIQHIDHHTIFLQKTLISNKMIQNANNKTYTSCGFFGMSSLNWASSFCTFACIYPPY